MELEVTRLSDLQTPFYLYDKNTMVTQFQELASMPNAYGLEIAYAMKAMPNEQVLRIFKTMGAKIDASSFNQVKRAIHAGFKPSDISYTTQQILRNELLIEQMRNLVIKGMKFNVCSLKQYQLIRETSKTHNIRLSVRVHPGKGAGESNSRNTGDEYSCFGVHLKDIPSLLQKSENDNVVFDEIHIHVGSGGKVEAWKDHIVDQMQICRKYFKNTQLKKINFGGGFKVRRVPSEETIDVKAIGNILKSEVQMFGNQTHTKPITVVQSGTFLMANSGYVFTNIIDIKETEKFSFLILNGGMQVNTRPMLYGSKHPFYLYSNRGVLKSSDWSANGKEAEYVVVGRCCQSGDSQTLEVVQFEQETNSSHSDKFKIAPRSMAIAQIGDILVIGGTGAYCSSMTLNNYNSHFIPAQYLIEEDGSIAMIRKEQSFKQIIQNQTFQKLAI